MSPAWQRGWRLIAGARAAWGVALAIAVAAAAAAYRLTPLRPVGMARDDGEYLAYALALLAGLGFVDPADPGHPPAARYPIGYPLLLAAVLQLAPEPIPAALALGPLCLGVALLAGWQLLHRVGGLPPWAATALTGLGALDVTRHEFAATTRSDVPFAALAALALLVLERPLREPRAGDAPRWLLGGLLVGAATLVRSAGWALVLALGWVAWRRGRLREAWPAVAPIALMVGGWSAWDAVRGAQSYGATFAATMPEGGAAWLTRAGLVLGQLLGGDLAACLWPLKGLTGAWPVAASIGLALLALAGTGRWLWRPASFAPGTELAAAFAATTVAISVVWSLGFVQFSPGVQARFLFPAAPGLAIAAWGLGRLAWRGAPGGRAAVAAALVGALALAAWSFQRHPVGQALGPGRAALLARRADWDALFAAIRAVVPPGGRVVSQH
ncbi:MAG: hypothetical protein VKQ33_10820, partial [Candidatus Sericytochromatia bacterium]|nr:hypothetical protein [Candidatus Sericytochromatia bacterium]